MGRHRDEEPPARGTGSDDIEATAMAGQSQNLFPIFLSSISLLLWFVLSCCMYLTLSD